MYHLKVKHFAIKTFYINTYVFRLIKYFKTNMKFPHIRFNLSLAKKNSKGPAPALSPTHDHKLRIFLSQNFKLLSITFAEVLIINQNFNIVFECSYLQIIKTVYQIIFEIFVI